MPAASPALPDNVAGALCYLCMPVSSVALLLLPPFRQRPFVRFHAMQAILTCAAMLCLSLGLRVLTRALFILPLVGRLIGVLMLLAMSVGIVALWMWLMYQAWQGKRYKLPFLGDQAEAQAG